MEIEGGFPSQVKCSGYFIKATNVSLQVLLCSPTSSVRPLVRSKLFKAPVHCGFRTYRTVPGSSIIYTDTHLQVRGHLEASNLVSNAIRAGKYVDVNEEAFFFFQQMFPAT